ncbi:MAG: hypothetical protein ABFR95_02515 [Actinomycetota bacterium]
MDTDQELKELSLRYYIVGAAILLLSIATLIRFRINGLGPAVITASIAYMVWHNDRTNENPGNRRALVGTLWVAVILCLALWIGTALGWAD